MATPQPTIPLDEPTRDTVALPAGPRPRRVTGDQAPTEVHTPQDAMRNAEIARTRSLVPFAIALAGVNAVALHFLGGHPVAKLWVYAGIGAATLAVTYLLWLTGHRERFTTGRVAAVFAVCIVGLFASVYYWGLFSPAANGIVLGLFFVGMGRDVAMSRLLGATAIAMYLLLSVLVISGAIPDYGMLRADELGTRDQVITQVLVLATMIVTYLLARASRDQLERAMTELDEAARAVAQREALLQEARAELDNAMRIGGPGRFTDQVIGSFKLGIVIGRGAHAEVYEALDVETGTAAAVKLLHGAANAGDPDALTRFLREARAAASLQSPHVARLLEVGGEDAPLPYLALERLRGEDLSERLRQQRRLAPATAIELVRHIARGLDTAHAAGIVHRDIKPQNLFYARAGDGALWKLLDFGVSRFEDHHGTLTQGRVVGTPVYMSPEQARGAEIDYRADIYSLAAVAYRTLTGRPPFTGRDLPGILYNVVYAMPPRPSALTELPPEVDLVLAIGIAKDPSRRFETAGELADALEAALGGEASESVRRRGEALLAERPWSRA